MDSESEFDTMLNALPQKEKNNYRKWPYSYVENHYVESAEKSITL